MVNEIQVGSYNALLHKLLSMKEGAPAPSLAPEILAAFVLESDRPEWAFLKGEHLFSWGRTFAGVAGNTWKFTLLNPLGSGVIAIINTINFGLTNGNTDLWFAGTNGPAIVGIAPFTSAPGVSRDTRFGVQGGFISNCLTGSLNSVGLFLPTSQANWLFVHGSTCEPVPLTVILGPGFQFVWEQSAINTTVLGMIEWRERILDPAETR